MTNGVSLSGILAGDWSIRRMALPASLVLGCLVLAALITLVVVRRPPSFDGAMNLQVAWSLSNGGEYQRSYADRNVFPKEVQTNAPYVVPAAALYRILGVDYFSSQLINLVYFYILLLVCYMLVRRQYGATSAALAPIAIMVTPGVVTFGFSGYGEIPALTWALFSLLLFTGRESSARIALAGLCLGLAVCTKTVMAICVFTFGVGYVIALTFRPNASISWKASRIALLVAAALLPILLVEIWRYVSLGGLHQFKAWWETSLASIGRQAGTQTGYQDTLDLPTKVSSHLSLLGDMLGLPMPLLIIWLAGPFLIVPLALLKTGWSRKRLSICLPLIAAGIYLTWWLALTPTQKAWHRRILDGALLLNLCWVWAGALIYTRMAAWSVTSARISAALLLVSASILFGTFFNHDLRRTLTLRTGDLGLGTAISIVRALPRDAIILGIGWDSAPVISLLSERPFEDVNNVPISSLRGRETYFVADNTTAESDVNSIIDTYRSTLLSPHGNPYRVYRVDFGALSSGVSSNPTGIRIPRVLDTRAKPKTTSTGFYGPEADGAWMSSEANIWLRYHEGAQLGLRAYLPDLALYTSKGKPISIDASIDGCALESTRLTKSGLQEIWFDMPPRCAPDDGESVLVRISSDALLINSITRDDRALFAKVPLLGFAPPGLLDKVSESDNSMEDAASSAPDSLKIESLPGAYCQRDQDVFTARVQWHIRPRKGSAGGIHLWVSQGDSTPKLWLSSGSARGDATTGEWVREGTRFTILSESGREVISAVAIPPSCPGN